MLPPSGRMRRVRRLMLRRRLLLWRRWVLAVLPPSSLLRRLRNLLRVRRANGRRHRGPWDTLSRPCHPRLSLVTSSALGAAVGFITFDHHQGTPPQSASHLVDLPTDVGATTPERPMPARMPLLRVLFNPASSSLLSLCAPLRLARLNDAGHFKEIEVTALKRYGATAV